MDLLHRSLSLTLNLFQQVLRWIRLDFPNKPGILMFVYGLVVLFSIYCAWINVRLMFLVNMVCTLLDCSTKSIVLITPCIGWCGVVCFVHQSEMGCWARYQEMLHRVSLQFHLCSPCYSGIKYCTMCVE